MSYHNQGQPHNQTQNRLLNRYQQSQQTQQLPFQNNQLLQRNPVFHQSAMNNNSEQMKQIQYMQQMQAAKMQRIKEAQQMKQLERFNEIDKTYTPEQIKKSVINPLKLDKKTSANDLINTLKDRYDLDIVKKKNFGNQHKEVIKQFKDGLLNQKKTLWTKRTNTPYKNIIKDSKFVNKFTKNPTKKIKKTELMVHKVTEADKEGVEEDFEELKVKNTTHDGELKVEYSTTKETEFKKAFEYNHRSKFRIKYDPSDNADHSSLKKNKLEALKKEQKKATKSERSYDSILQAVNKMNIYDDEDGSGKMADVKLEDIEEGEVDDGVNGENREGVQVKPIKITRVSGEDEVKVKVKTTRLELKPEVKTQSVLKMTPSTTSNMSKPEPTVSKITMRPQPKVEEVGGKDGKDSKDKEDRYKEDDDNTNNRGMSIRTSNNKRSRVNMQTSNPNNRDYKEQKLSKPKTKQTVYTSRNTGKRPEQDTTPARSSTKMQVSHGRSNGAFVMKAGKSKVVNAMKKKQVTKISFRR